MAIESILGSKYDNFELLLVSDGVGKNDLLKLEKWTSDPRVTLVESTGRGLVEALNSGIRASSSRYIARMDHDDISAPGRLLAQVAFLDANPKVDVVGTNIELICPHDQIIGKSHYPRRLRRSFLTKPFSAQVAHPTVMMRRDSVVQIEMYRNFYLGSSTEDLDLWNRILRQGRIRNLRQALLRYRVHPDQISTSRQAEQAESTRLAVLVDIYESYGLTQTRQIPSLTAKELDSLLLSKPYRRMLSWRGQVRLAFFLSRSKSMAAIGQLAVWLKLSSRQPSAGIESPTVIAKWIFGNPVMFIVSGLMQFRAIVSKLYTQKFNKPCKDCAVSP
jgi:hypothetical protein